MSFNLGHGRELSDAIGIIGLSESELPPLPDEAITNPALGLIDPRSFFKAPGNRFEIEIGCGKGSFILESAKASPDTNYFGIEWAREFYLYTADRLRRAGVQNARMLRTDATDFFRWRVPSGVASVIHLYFSDPWPKAKHHKNRVVQHRFLAECWRVLAPQGELRVVTDHDDLWEWDQRHFAVWTSRSLYDAWITDGCKQEVGIVPVTSLPAVLSQGIAPFTAEPFTPPVWVGEGQTVGTNYEKKMCGDFKEPHSVTLKKNG